MCWANKGDWDKLVFTFNEDGTYTITSPAGKEYTSYKGDDGLVHLDYTADASAQLVAKLYIK